MTITFALAQIRTVWNNSELGASIELGHSVLGTYTEENDLEVDLVRIQDNADAFMDNVEALRKQYSADRVSLIVAPNNLGAPESLIC